MWWNWLPIPKLQRLHCWSLGMDKYFHPTLNHACDCLSMLGLNLNHVSERGPPNIDPELIAKQHQNAHQNDVHLKRGPLCQEVYCCVDVLRSFAVHKQIIRFAYQPMFILAKYLSLYYVKQLSVCFVEWTNVKCMYLRVFKIISASLVLLFQNLDFAFIMRDL